MELSNKDYYVYENLDAGRVPVTIPYRVKSGKADESGLTLVTTDKTIQLNWDQIEMLALGYIRNESDSTETPTFKIQKFMKQMILSESDKGDKKITNIRQIYLLDIFIKGMENPYRIDQSMIDYRGFVEKPGYISINNFKELINRIVCYSTEARLNPNTVFFITGSKNRIICSSDVYQFEKQCQKERKNLENLTHQNLLVSQLKNEKIVENPDSQKGE